MFVKERLCVYNKFQKYNAEIKSRPLDYYKDKYININENIST